MAKAVFHRSFGYSSPDRNIGWHAFASPDAQSFPRAFIDAAVKAGVATEVAPRRSLARAEVVDSAPAPAPTAQPKEG